MLLHYFIKICIIFIIITIVLFVCNIFKTRDRITGGKTYEEKANFKKVNLYFMRR